MCHTRNFKEKKAEIHSLCVGEFFNQFKEPLSFKEEVPLLILLFVCCLLHQSCSLFRERRA